MKFAKHRLVYSLHAPTECPLDSDPIHVATREAGIVFRRPPNSLPVTGNFSSHACGSSPWEVGELIEQDIAVNYFALEHLMLGVRVFIWEFVPSVRPVTLQLANGKLKGQCWCPHCSGRGYLGFRAKGSFSPCPVLDSAIPQAVRKQAAVMGVPCLCAD